MIENKIKYTDVINSENEKVNGDFIDILNNCNDVKIRAVKCSFDGKYLYNIYQMENKEPKTFEEIGANVFVAVPTDGWLSFYHRGSAGRGLDTNSQKEIRIISDSYNDPSERKNIFQDFENKILEKIAKGLETENDGDLDDTK